MQVSSFNEDAFRSAGKTTVEVSQDGTKQRMAATNAAICYKCAGLAGTVLQYLLTWDLNDDGKEEASGRHVVLLARDDRKSGTRQPLRNHIAVFWTKQPVRVETAHGQHAVDELPRWTLQDLEELPDDGPPAYATQIRDMLQAPWKGGKDKTALGSNRFYLAVLSPNKSRLVVREWLEEGVEPLRQNLKHYVEALQIIHPDGRDIWFPPLPAMLTALQSPTSAKCKKDEKARLPQVEPDLMRKMIRCMFTGTPPPDALLTRAVRCFRVPDPPTEDRDRPQRERQVLRRMSLAAAMKLVLTHGKTQQEQHAMEQLVSETPGDYKARPPYLCGRLLAVLEEVQRQASGKPGGVNTTLVDRFYGAASTAPASVFANLINVASKAHLPKLRREGRDFISQLMEEVCGELDDAGGFPPPLSPEEQAQFALGFYHQRAQFALKRREAARARQAKHAAADAKAKGKSNE